MRHIYDHQPQKCGQGQGAWPRRTLCRHLSSYHCPLQARGAFFEIACAAAFKTNTDRISFYANARKLVYACRGTNIILSVDAKVRRERFPIGNFDVLMEIAKVQFFFVFVSRFLRNLFAGLARSPGTSGRYQSWSHDWNDGTAGERCRQKECRGQSNMCLCQSRPKLSLKSCDFCR